MYPTLLLLVPLGFLSLWFTSVVIFQKARKVTFLLFRFVLQFAAIRFENDVWNKLLHCKVYLPRNMGEVFDDPKRFERLLVSNGVVDQGFGVEKMERLAAITTEPDKQATAGSIRVHFKRGNETKVLDMFLKFQTGRGLPFWLQAVRAAAEPGVCREVDFYSKVRPSVPIRTLKPFMALKQPMINYVLTALEFVDLEGGQARVVTDGTGATLSEVKIMMMNVAKMHGAFAGGRVEQDAATNWIPARRGLEYANFVESFMVKSDKAWTEKVWYALCSYFDARPVTLVHGDCRPGNMMFEGTDRDNVHDVIFADWEAVNVAPFMWDLTYCTTLGWSADARRQNIDEVLAIYLTSLAKSVEVPKFLDEKEARMNVALLTLVLGYVSRVVRLRGFWSKQGNNMGDAHAWFVRIALAINDLNPADLAAELGIDAADIIKIQRDAVDEVNREVQRVAPNVQDLKLDEL